VPGHRDPARRRERGQVPPRAGPEGGGGGHPAEAAAQYERALRFANRLDRPGLAALQEGVAGEYALLDHWEEAESALRAALELRRQLGDDLSVGEDLRLLSRALWRLCRGTGIREEEDCAVSGPGTASYVSGVYRGNPNGTFPGLGGNGWLWLGDYNQHQATSYTITVNGSSTRVQIEATYAS
jgi:tetratricopeptide (TPR) repeat protein